ncbi:SDR family NAD(P)-dependent oxidoreductase [Methylobacterium sp. CM6257]
MYAPPVGRLNQPVDQIKHPARPNPIEKRSRTGRLAPPYSPAACGPVPWPEREPGQIASDTIRARDRSVGSCSAGCWLERPRSRGGDPGVIGAATAKRFASPGARIVRNDRTCEPRRAVAASREGRRSAIQTGDVSDRAAAEALIAVAVDQFGRPRRPASGTEVRAIEPGEQAVRVTGPARALIPGRSS